MPRVLLLDDDAFVRVGVAAAIQSLGYEVRATGSSAEALAAAASFSPNAAVLDIHLGQGPTGVDVALALRKRQPDIGVVMLTSLDDPRLIGERRALPRGTVYLPKQQVASADDYHAALAQALDVKQWQSAAEVDSRFRALTANQIELLRLIAAGYSNSEIAVQREQREKSVESAVTRLAKTLGLGSRPGRALRLELANIYFHGLGAGRESAHLD